MTSAWTRVTRPEDWSDLLVGLDPYPLVQTWAWGQAKARTGTRIERLRLGDLLTVQVELRGPVAWVPGGPISRPGRVVLAGSVVELSRAVGRPLLAAPHRPIEAARPLRSGPYLRGTVILDLGEGVKRVKGAFDKRWRNALSKAERSSIGIRDGTVGELYGLLEPMAARKGFRVPYPRMFVEALAHELGDDLSLRFAEVDTVPVAAWAEARIGSTATYLLGASTEPGRMVNATYALAWDAVARGISRGVHFIDLGGADPDAADGPDQFKLRTGGEVWRFPGTYLFGRGPRRLLARLAAAAGVRRVVGHGRS